VFPPPSHAEESGLLAVGGDLASERLLTAYAQGIFPWYEEPPILWFSPDPRMVLRPDQLRVTRRMRRTLRSGAFELRLDTAFDNVMRACASAPRPDQLGTWINPDMLAAYGELHALGYAHSAEAYQEGALVGGVYGVSLGAAFFAESMFHAVRDASKAALFALVWQLEAWNFQLLDCQLHTEHLASLGAQEVPRADYLRALARALRRPTRRGAWQLDPAVLAARLAPPPSA
jgi:leucyl/phenylalanyl-tRNA--protein transferase